MTKANVLAIFMCIGVIIALTASVASDIQRERNSAVTEDVAFGDTIALLDSGFVRADRSRFAVSLLEIDGHKYVITTRSKAMSTLHAASCECMEGR